ncbi:hypothetical protein AY600_00405 [Phormidium willei BDU 130791]|nr:hypothetical protein AY600_00405 [Phormidium willei BDU 130791]
MKIRQSLAILDGNRSSSTPIMSETIFHLAFPVGNLDDTKAFYGDGLGCELGQESPQSLYFTVRETRNSFL